MITIYQLFCFATLALFLTTLLGKSFFLVFNSEIYQKSQFYSKCFFELIVGTTLIVFFKSIIATSFQTINVLFLLLIFEYLFFCFRDKTRIFNFRLDTFSINKRNIVNSFVLFFFFVLIFLAQSSVFYSYPEASFKTPDRDLLFYGRLSNCISTFGKENLLFFYNPFINPQKNGIGFYHYFDLWYNSFFLQLFRLTSYHSILFITYPIFTFIAFVGIVSLWEKIGKINLFKLVLSLLLLVIGGMYFEFYKLFQYMINTIPLLTDTMPFTYYGRKLMPVLILSILALNLFYERKTHHGLMCMLCTIIVYTGGTMFEFWGSFALLFLAYLIFQHRIKWFIIEKRTIFCGVLLMIFFSLFTYCNQLKGYSDAIFLNSVLNFHSISDLIHHFRAAAAVLFRFSLLFVFCYFLYLALIFLNLKIIKEHLIPLKLYVLVLSVALSIGFCFMFFFYKDLNSRQFVTNLLPYLNTFIIFCFIVFYEKVQTIETRRIRKWMSIGVCFVILFLNLSWIENSVFIHTSVSQKYSSSFMSNVCRTLAKYPKNERIAFRLHLDEYVLYNPPYFNQWLFLDLYGYENVVNNSKINIAKLNTINYVNSEMKDFVNAKKDTLNYQLQFLVEKKIKIVVADTIQTNIPQAMIKEFFVDKSNECIYFLK